LYSTHSFLKLCYFFFFFFSSRRRHTRWPRDWSSDVCSSDLELRPRKRTVLVPLRRGDRRERERLCRGHWEQPHREVRRGRRLPHRLGTLRFPQRPVFWVRLCVRRGDRPERERLRRGPQQLPNPEVRFERQLPHCLGESRLGGRTVRASPEPVPLRCGDRRGRERLRRRQVQLPYPEVRLPVSRVPPAA